MPLTIEKPRSPITKAMPALLLPKPRPFLLRTFAFGLLREKTWTAGFFVTADGRAANSTGKEWGKEVIQPTNPRGCGRERMQRHSTRHCELQIVCVLRDGF